MTHPSYLIIGCGHFGSKAVEKLHRKNPKSKIIVVDKNKRALQKVSHLPIETIVFDGTLFLTSFLSEGRGGDYIIPAVPFHLAFEFLLSKLRPFGAKRSKVPVLSGLPNPMRGKTGDLYASFANFLCPEDCPEPSQYCTVTRESRPNPLYKILMDLTGPFESRVIRSQQIGLGVGGFKPGGLKDLLEDIKKRRDSDRLILISTACRCHGVISALSF
jgi:hypothetical protein